MADREHSAGYPWAPASATGVGSMPGTGPVEAMRVILGELPDLPHLAELPGRGPAAGLTGRAAALLIDMPAELAPSGWRLTYRPGRDLRRARDLLAADLDALEETAQGYQGPLKVQVAGPWTMAATLELARSQDPVLADSGAVADLTESLGEGVRAHLGQVRKRVPGATVILQLDEPALPRVIAGQVRSASGLRRLPPPETADVEARLRAVLSGAGAFTIVHCCASPVPFGIIARAGADGVSFDLGQLGRGGEDALAETVEAGLGILAGVVPATPRAAPAGPAGSRMAAGRAAPGGGRVAAGTATRGTVTDDTGTGGTVTGGTAAPQGGAGEDAAAEGDVAGGGLPRTRTAAQRVMDLWRRMGWPAGRRDGRAAGRAGLPQQIVLTPACGLAGAPPGYARAALAGCREAARLLPELMEED